MPALGLTRRGRAVALVLAVAACTSNDPDAVATPTTEANTTSTTTTTAPERPASTTTTEFDPASVEGQVEAAYLKSWDVYADAVYDLELDEEALASVYAGDALELRIAEVERRIDEDRASLVDLEHDYQIVVAGSAMANVIDNAVNHQVLIDPRSKVPTEPDPNDQLILNFKVELIDESWQVTFIQKVAA